VGHKPGGGGDDPFVPALLKALARRFDAEVTTWARDRVWQLYVPLLVFFGYVWVRHLGELEYTNFFFGGINLGIHEAGHLLFRPFGEFLMVAGGTICQCLAPCIALVLFYRAQREFFAVPFCCAWLGTNCFNCGTYAADARGQLNLVLVSPGGQMFGADGMGDWSRMLRTLGMLEWDTTISWLWRAAGTGCFLTAFATGAWLCWKIHTVGKQPPPPPPSWA